ncbi:MAG: HD domain-containing phosphohydrolase [Thermoanaerobaculia bacterium]
MNKLKNSNSSKEKGLRLALEILPDPVAIHSEGVIIFVNDACVKALEGKSKEEIVGKRTLSFVHEKYKTFVAERIKSLSRGVVFKNLVEEIFITLKGRPIYVEVAAAPIKFEGKESILVIFRDITEKKIREEKLLHLESLLKSIHKIDQAILEGKREKYLISNIWENLRRVKGYSFAWIGKAKKKNIYPAIEYSEDDFLIKIKKIKGNIPENLLLKQKKILYGKIPYKYEEYQEWNQICQELKFKSFCLVPIKIGNKLWGSINLYALEENSFDLEERTFLEEIGTEIGFALYSLEIKEEERKAKNELKISEGKMKALLEALEDSVFSFDRRGRFTFYHSKIKDSSDLPQEVFVGKKFTEVFPEIFVEKMNEAFSESLKGKSAEFEYWQNHKGRTLWFSVKLSPLYFKNKIKGVVGVSRDITERILMEAEKINNFYKIQSTLEATVMALANAVELRDATTFGHQGRTAKLACAIAKKLGLPSEKIEGLRLAAHVHDVGKIAIPAEILAKPGKLLPIETELIKTHAQKGYEILKGIEFPWPVSEIVLQHSEHVDGSGYPNGLTKNQILEEARILAVADAIDAMCSHRPYRPALPIQDVIKQIKELSGKWYDEKVVEAAIELLNSGFRWF